MAKSSAPELETIKDAIQDVARDVVKIDDKLVTIDKIENAILDIIISQKNLLTQILEAVQPKEDDTFGDLLRRLVDNSDAHTAALARIEKRLAAIERG